MLPLLALSADAGRKICSTSSTLCRTCPAVNSEKILLSTISNHLTFSIVSTLAARREIDAWRDVISDVTAPPLSEAASDNDICCGGRGRISRGIYGEDEGGGGEFVGVKSSYLVIASAFVALTMPLIRSKQICRRKYGMCF